MSLLGLGLTPEAIKPKLYPMGKYRLKNRGFSITELLVVIGIFSLVAVTFSRFAQSATTANAANRAGQTAYQDLLVMSEEIKSELRKQRRDEMLAGKTTLNHLRLPGCGSPGCRWRTGEPKVGSTLNPPSQEHRNMVFEEVTSGGSVQRTEYTSTCSEDAPDNHALRSMGELMPVAIGRMRQHCMASCDWDSGQLPVVLKRTWTSWDDTNDSNATTTPSGYDAVCMPSRLFKYADGKCVLRGKTPISGQKQTLGMAFCSWAPVSMALGNVVSLRLWGFSRGGGDRMRITSMYSDASIGTLGSEVSVMSK